MVTPGNLRRILVVKLASLGDLLTITPALRALRTRYPDAHIGVLTTPGTADALAGLDSVNDVICFDKFAFDDPAQALRGARVAWELGARLRAGRWDALVLLHHLTTAFGTAKYAALARASGAPVRAGLDNGRGRWFLTHAAVDAGFGMKHEADYWLDVVALLDAPRPVCPRLEIASHPVAEAWADRTWSPANGPAALLSPGSGAFSHARRWPVDRFAEVGQALQRTRGLTPLVLAGVAGEERRLAESLAEAIGPSARILGPAPSPQALAALLRRCDLLIANDSGPVHVASAVGTPVVAIFGPTNHQMWGPYPADFASNQVAREVLACSPCIYRGHSLGTPAGCPARTCLQILRPSTVLDAVDRAAAGAPRRPMEVA